MGTLTQNTAGQPKKWISTPPTIGPAPKPRPATLAQMPMAPVRASGGYASIKIESVSGAMIAAPTPCSPRKSTSCASLRASPHARDNTVNTAIPTRNRRLRP